MTLPPLGVRLVVALTVAAGTLACSGGDEAGPPERVGDPPTTEATTTTTTATTEGSPTTAAPTTTAPPPEQVELVEVARVEQPTSMAFTGDGGRAFVTAQEGELWGFRRTADGWARDATAQLDLGDVVTTEGNEQGLLGVAVSPDDSSLVLHLTARGGPAGTVVVEGYPLDENGDVVAGGRTELLRVPQPFANHNGGQLAFGPDGMLYVGLGDGGSQGDPDDNGQDRGVLLAKVLRLQLTETGARPPADNPYVGNPAFRPEIWLYGVRNPWRFSFDQATGDLWIGDVGGSEREEINRLAATAGRDAGRGANLGWEAFEGTLRGDDEVEGTEPVRPWFEYTHDDGCSVTGGYVYRGRSVPGLDGTYLFGDYCRGAVWALHPSGDVRSISDPVDGLVSFAQDPSGEVYVLAREGGIHQIVAAG